MLPHRVPVLIALACGVATVSCGQVPPPPPDWPVTATPTEWNFDETPLGSVPAGWRVAETNGRGTPATWAVVEAGQDGGQAFGVTQTDNSGGTFNLAIAQEAVYGDLDLTVRVRPDRGEEDQGGGPVWRCIDENNYYVCRFNPLESNFRVYKVVQGKRSQLDSARTDAPAGEWSTLRVTMEGPEIRCYLDGELLLEVSDTTFPGAGLAGLWTKADAATTFDDLEVKPLE